MFEADCTAGVSRWHVVRLVAGSRAEVVLLSTRFFSLSTHWCKCTVPCAGDDCALCTILPVRGQFYVAVHCEGRVRLLELGAESSAHFEQHVRLFGGGMRAGLRVVVSRRGAKSPVHSEVIGERKGTKEIELLDLAAHVMALYKFPCPNPGQTLEEYERRVRAMAELRNRRLFEQMTVAAKR